MSDEANGGCGCFGCLVLVLLGAITWGVWRVADQAEKPHPTPLHAPRAFPRL